jgi:hypothetical protein
MLLSIKRLSPLEILWNVEKEVELKLLMWKPWKLLPHPQLKLYHRPLVKKSTFTKLLFLKAPSTWKLIHLSTPRRRIVPGTIKIHPTECALIVNYTIQDPQVTDGSSQSASKMYAQGVPVYHAHQTAIYSYC